MRHRLGAREKLAGGVSEGLLNIVLAREENNEGCFVVNMRDIEWIRGNVWAELIAGEESVPLRDGVFGECMSRTARLRTVLHDRSA